MGNHNNVAVVRQLVLQQPEVQRQHQTVGNPEAVARQLVVQQTEEQQVHKTVCNHDSMAVARQHVLRQP